MKINTTRLILALPLAFLVLSSAKAGVIYDGIDFPGGAASFADQVIRFNPNHSGGPVPTLPNFMDPNAALGAPDYQSSNGIETASGAYSLGSGGLLEVLFSDNALSNSGSGMADLHIFEIGQAVEATFVAVRPTASTAALLGSAFDADGDGFYEVGRIEGATASVDIDAFFQGFAAGQLVFDAVQLIDDASDGGNDPTIGADIDAIGAIASAPPVAAVPEPTALMIWSLAIVGLGMNHRRRRQAASAKLNG
ncbi:hypothetical protein Poly51_45410 [Rubripirellula tenax]|uniref:PEP-CTERM protein-sorting domain-containing protein n=1 Tax=Rubripirellula tenax TaxID=2528015 RepID=A0A5C6EJG7_9BACT|nr:hypothetical protein [Rubripirellula tenax]TWU48640.1 hypothetical protein Poly51_45410 [Rubripirellula tenax]